MRGWTLHHKEQRSSQAITMTMAIGLSNIMKFQILWCFEHILVLFTNVDFNLDPILKALEVNWVNLSISTFRFLAFLGRFCGLIPKINFH